MKVRNESIGPATSGDSALAARLRSIVLRGKEDISTCPAIEEAGEMPLIRRRFSLPDAAPDSA